MKPVIRNHRNERPSRLMRDALRCARPAAGLRPQYGFNPH